MKLIYSTCI